MSDTTLPPDDAPAADPVPAAETPQVEAPATDPPAAEQPAEPPVAEPAAEATPVDPPVVEPPAEPQAEEPPAEPPARPVIDQPPYLLIANALRSPDVLEIAELAAMRVASAIASAQGGPLPGEPTEPAMPDQVRLARYALARMIASRQIPQRILAIALLQAPDVVEAVASDPSNQGTALMTANLGAAWARNWTDYALLQAVIMSPAAPAAPVSPGA